jgi:hypothetical protein
MGAGVIPATCCKDEFNFGLTSWQGASWQGEGYVLFCNMLVHALPPFCLEEGPLSSVWCVLRVLDPMSQCMAPYGAGQQPYFGNSVTR